MVRLLIDDVTVTKTDRVNLHFWFRSGKTTSLAIPNPGAWQAPPDEADTFAVLGRLRDDHTDAETAAALNAARHRSASTATSRILHQLAHRRGQRSDGVSRVVMVEQRAAECPPGIRVQQESKLQLSLTGPIALWLPIRLRRPAWPGSRCVRVTLVRSWSLELTVSDAYKIHYRAAHY